MQVRVITMKYNEGQQGFSEEALRSATFGRDVLACETHFFTHGGAPHLTLVLQLADASGFDADRPFKPRDPNVPNPEDALPEELRGVYRDLKKWRNDKAKSEGRPAYAIVSSGSNRVNRGGSWNNNANNCRSAYRNNNYNPSNYNNNLGFRLSSTLPPRPGSAGSHSARPALRECEDEHARPAAASSAARRERRGRGFDGRRRRWRSDGNRRLSAAIEIRSGAA